MSVGPFQEADRRITRESRFEVAENDITGIFFLPESSG